jgi:flagellar biosynthesis/type III secretory pathway protein FliH
MATNEEILKNEYFNLGKKEGIEKAQMNSFEEGYKKGIEKGIEIGIYKSFLKTIKKLIEKNNNNNNYNKIIKIINKINFDNEDDLKQKYILIKTNLKNIHNKKNKIED